MPVWAWAIQCLFSYMALGGARDKNKHRMVSRLFLLKQDGSLWACGEGLDGNLGTGSTVTYIYTPQQVMTGVKAVSVRDSHTLILKTDSSLWACGWNYCGQLGDGTTTNCSTPKKITTDVVDMSAGSMHSMILKTDGTIWACGRNDDGQLGDGTNNDRYTLINIEFDIQVTSITLDKTSLSLQTGQSEKLTAIVKPDNATNRTVTWSSSPTGIVTVDNNGKVSAISAGNTTITCKANDGSSVQATCTVVVKNIVKPESISLPETATVAKGQTITLIPEITPADAETTLTWASNDETIATVDADGVVTGVKKGMTFITVTTDNGLEAFCELTVTEPVAPEPTKITIPQKLSVSVGQRLKIEYTLVPENAETTVTWTISKDIATIDDDGFITGKAEGTAVIKATTANGVKSNDCRLTVTPAPEIKGDVNGDGTVDVADISAIIIVMAGQGNEATEKKADVNGDSTVDVADISAVIIIMAARARMQAATEE